MINRLFLTTINFPYLGLEVPDLDEAVAVEADEEVRIGGEEGGGAVLRPGGIPHHHLHPGRLGSGLHRQQVTTTSPPCTGDKTELIFRVYYKKY